MGYFNNTTLDAYDAYLKFAVNCDKPLTNSIDSTEGSVYGTDAGIYVEDGVKGGAVRFPYDASSMPAYVYFDKTHDLTLTNSNGFFFSAWIKSTSIYYYPGMIFQVGDDVPILALSLSNYAPASTLAQKGRLMLDYVVMDANWELKKITANLNPDYSGPPYSWINISGCYDTGIGMRLYVNGNCVGILPVTQYPMDASLSKLKIGVNSGLYIDELYVWEGGALTEAGFASVVSALQSNYLAQLIAKTSEDVGFSDSIYPVYLRLLEETLNVVEINATQWEGARTLSESVDFSDSAYQGWAEIVEYSLALAESHATQLEGNNTLAETLVIYDVLLWQWKKVLSESLVISESHDIQLGILLEEWIGFLQSNSTNWDGVESISEILKCKMIPEMIGQFSKSLSESLVLTDSLEKVISVIVEEWMKLLDVTDDSWNGAEVVAESFNIKDDDTIVQLFIELVEDGLSISDALSAVVKLIVQESIQFNVAQLGKLELIGTLSESLGLSEAVVGSWVKVLSESLGVADSALYTAIKKAALEEGISLSDSESFEYIKKLLLSEGISFSESTAGQGTFSSTCSESLSIIDVVTKAWLEQLTETLGVSEAMTVGWLFACSLTENLAVSESLTLQRTSYSSLSESVQVVTAMSVSATLNAIVQENLGVSFEVELDGDVWQAWVLNTAAFHPSVYSNFDFNSYCVYKANAYGANSDGIYQLDGSTDAGADIRTGVALPQTQFGTSRNKRFRRAYLGLSGGSPSIRMETDNGSDVYNVVEGKARVGRDLKGKKWTIKVQDFNSMDFVELVPIILTR